MNDRRAFLKNAGIALFGIGIGGVPSFLTKAVAAEANAGLFQKKKILVCIFQRGAMDGLMAVTPFNDKFLKEARPTLFMQPGKQQDENALFDLDGTFGLHPAFSSFIPLFRQKQMAIVHGMGSPNNTRSHFDAQDYMESGNPFSKKTASGWLNRAAEHLGHDHGILQAVSLSATLPKSLYGNHPAMAIQNIGDFANTLSNPRITQSLAAKSFEELYEETTSSLLRETGKESFEAIKLLQKTYTKNYQPQNGAQYPTSPLGNSLKQIAQLIKMNVGLEIAVAESGGWDTHFNQGKGNGSFARNATDFSKSIAAFWNDLGVLQDDVTIMTMTEFGRTVKQNGTGGTDHGRASCNFIIG
ncbi:MAG: DUF1501 domain-containing protein, partial [Chitinophagaceae bacterium]